MNEIPCLDKGYVRLVDHMGNDLSIVRSARVSYNAEWRAGQDEGKDEKLIKYLWKNQHLTPFESVVFTFEVKAPIFVYRQWHRHRTQSYNEVSARYTELENEYYVPEPEVIGIQDKNNKQGRNITGGHLEDCDWYKLDLEGEHHDCTCGFDKIKSTVEKEYVEACENAFGEYDYLLSKGWPRELARMVLPLSTYSKMFTTANLRNWLHFLELRLHPHAQYEIRVYAEAILNIISGFVPIATSAFQEGLNK